MDQLTVTKEAVLKAAAACPTAKETLKILFPDAFKPTLDWGEFYRNPWSHLVPDGPDRIMPSAALLEACRVAGSPIPGGLYPAMTLRMMERFFTHLIKVAQENTQVR